MRTLLLELRPSALTDIGLDVLLHQFAEAMASRSRLSVDVRSEGTPRPLPADDQVTLYRLAQESLNNVAKHAQAQRAIVQVSWLPDAVRLEIEEDGCGFDPAAVPPGHLGLGIMLERAAPMGATVEVSSHPGQGTRVRIVWPDRRAGT